jgi:hypothetical protein
MYRFKFWWRTDSTPLNIYISLSGGLDKRKYWKRQRYSLTRRRYFFNIYISISGVLDKINYLKRKKYSP